MPPPLPLVVDVEVCPPIEEHEDDRLLSQLVRWKQEFVAALRKNPNISKACLAAGMSRATTLEHRAKDLVFAQLWDAAVDAHADEVEETCWTEATAGHAIVTERKSKDGSCRTTSCTVRDSRYMELWLRGNRPEKYDRGAKGVQIKVGVAVGAVEGLMARLQGNGVPGVSETRYN